MARETEHEDWDDEDVDALDDAFDGSLDDEIDDGLDEGLDDGLDDGVLGDGDGADLEPSDGEIDGEDVEVLLEEDDEEDELSDPVVVVKTALFEDLVPKRGRRGTVDDESDDEDDEFELRERQAHEFVCGGCYLVRNRTQLRVVDGTTQLCVDCA